MTQKKRYLVVEGITHGLTGYTHHKCRCETCRVARREYVRKYRESAETDLPPDDKRHGRRSTYIMRNCRCEKCIKAARDYYHKQREKKADDANTSQE